MRWFAVACQPFAAIASVSTCGSWSAGIQPVQSYFASQPGDGAMPRMSLSAARRGATPIAR
jgi:hypothetical protein